jgi:hypothetical protein
MNQGEIVPDHLTPMETVSTDPPPIEAPMTLEEALADPDKFFAGMTESQTWSQFIPIPPLTLRPMLGPVPVTVQPMKYGQRMGSLVSTASKAVHDALLERFRPRSSWSHEPPVKTLVTQVPRPELAWEHDLGGEG